VSGVVHSTITTHTDSLWRAEHADITRMVPPDREILENLLTTLILSNRQTSEVLETSEISRKSFVPIPAAASQEK
jgi:hypothetical protein